VAAAQASEAAQQVYAEAQEDVERTGEIVREADALEAEAGDAFRKAQKQGFAKDRE
jgi:phage host-nuclease inhibitor protein Gam